MAEPPTSLPSRTIPFRDASVRILLQDRNGPCPVIALFNALVLRGLIAVPPTAVAPDGSVPSSVVSNTIATYAMERANSMALHVNNREYLIADMLEALPRLWSGMDVNVRFDGIRSYENTREISLLEMCGVPLVHGWLLGTSDGDAEIRKEVNGRSYNAMIEAVVSGKAPLFAAWSETYASQLTPYGLRALREGMGEDLPTVFFRNNHFATLLLHQSSLYVLVTDVGMARAQPSTPWESMVDVAGAESKFVAVWREKSTPLPRGVPTHAPLNGREQPARAAAQPIPRGRVVPQEGSWGTAEHTTRTHAPYERYDDDNRCWCCML